MVVKLGLTWADIAKGGESKRRIDSEITKRGMALLVLEGVWSEPTMKVDDRVNMAISRVDLRMVGRDLGVITIRLGEGVTRTLGLGAKVVVTRGVKRRGKITERWMLGPRCAGSGIW
jgi:hypothetical protein